MLKSDVKIVRPQHIGFRPKSRAADKTRADPLDRAQVANEEMKQLNLKRIQFILKQENRNSETVRCMPVCFYEY